MDILKLESETNNFISNLKIGFMVNHTNEDSLNIDFKLVEKFFSESFDAENLATRNMSFDAILKSGNKKIGIGLKTFTVKSRQAQSEKIAEFNKLSKELNSLSGLELVKKVSELRNQRIMADIRQYGIDEMYYICVLRAKKYEEKYFYVKQFDYSLIDINKIRLLDRAENAFTDGKYEYSFNRSKNTLFKKFEISENGLKPTIIDYDLEFLKKAFSTIEKECDLQKNKLILPMYSFKNKEKIIYKKSGLNIWNAGGRKRDLYEAYIPLNGKVREKAKSFFGSSKFTLVTDNGIEMTASLCQQNSKALMTNPNKDITDWICQIINLNSFEVPEDEIHDYANNEDYKLIKNKNKNTFTVRKVISYDDLLYAGKDSIYFEKISDNKFKIRLVNIEESDFYLKTY